MKAFWRIGVIWVLAGAGCAGTVPDTAASVSSTVAEPPSTPAVTIPSSGATTSATVVTTTTTEAAPPSSSTTTTAAEAAGNDAPPGPTLTAPGPEPGLRRITPDRPLRVWVIGDSLAGPLGEALRGAVVGNLPVEVRVEHEEGTGLTRPDLFDWPGLIAARLPDLAPDAVVIHIGANDSQHVRTESGWAEFGTPDWVERYREIVGSTMDLVLADTTRLYWVGAPIMQSTRFSNGMQLVNGVFTDEAGRRSAAIYVDAYALFQDDAGRYASMLPGPDGEPVTMRQADGVHYTAAGAAHLARHVLAVIAADWGLGDATG